jgi:biopolymer transport protein ExbD
MLNKRAQVGETMTWVVATVIILVMLVIFIYASSILAAKTAKVSLEAKTAEVDDSANWIEEKNGLALNLNGNKKSFVENWIKGWEEDE